MRSIAHNGIWDMNSATGKKNYNMEKKMLRTALALTSKKLMTYCSLIIKFVA